MNLSSNPTLSTRSSPRPRRPKRSLTHRFPESLSETRTPVVCVDLAVPRDFSVEFLLRSRVSLIDIPYLKSRGNGNLRQKFVEAGKANEIVREAVNQYLADRVELTLKPIFQTAIRNRLSWPTGRWMICSPPSLTNLDD